MSTDAAFTPAAGRIVPTAAYDRLLAWLTREAQWRTALIAQLAPQPGDRILDVGSGTGSLAILLKQLVPDAHIVGLDPDPVAQQIAEAKAVRAGVDIEWRSGFARNAGDLGKFDKVVSSLVFHQVPLAEKQLGLTQIFSAAKPGGRVVIADYMTQAEWAMRLGFKIIQAADGKADTQPNADGYIERTVSSILKRKVVPCWRINTPTGTISILSELAPKSA